jgi:hypothetical protein
MGEAAWLSIFGLGKASTRKHIRSDLRPRSNATKDKKGRHPTGQEHFAVSGGVARSLQTHAGMRVTRALPATTNCSCAVSSYL